MALTKTSTDGIKDDAVTLDKLAHGTSSQDGKFLRANNGAAPSFETVSIPAGTTINGNTDNRIITATGTANTLEGEANLTFSSNTLTVHEASLKGNQLLFNPSGTAYIDHSTTGQDIQFRTSVSSSQDTTGPTIKSNGNVGIGTASPDQKLKIQDSNDLAIHLLKTGVQDTLIKNTGQTEICAATGGASGQRIAFKIGANTGSLADIAKFTPDGLCFGTDTAAVNALSDYEEGTYTPVVRGSGGWAAATNSASGIYIKIGKMVMVSIQYSSSNMNGVSGGSFLRCDLPFSARTSGMPGTLMCSEWSIGTSSVSWVGGEINANDNKITFHYHNGNNNNTNLFYKGNIGSYLAFKGTAIYHTT